MAFACLLTTGQANAQTNWALNKTTYASSNQNDAQNAADGNEGTRWQAATTGLDEWWYVDLGESIPLDYVEIQWEAAYAKQFRLYGTTKTPDEADGTGEWTELGTFTTEAAGWNHYSVLGHEARYIKIAATELAMAYGFSMWEFQVYKKTENPVLTGIELSDIYLMADMEKAVTFLLKDQEGGLMRGEAVLNTHLAETGVVEIVSSDYDTTNESGSIRLKALAAGNTRLTLTATVDGTSQTVEVPVRVLGSSYTWKADIGNMEGLYDDNSIVLTQTDDGVNVSISKGQDYSGFRLKDLPDEVRYGEYTCVHVIGSCPKADQKVRGRFGHGEEYTTTVSIPETWQDFVLYVYPADKRRSDLTEVFIMLDHGVAVIEGQPKEMTVKEIVFNNSAELLIKNITELSDGDTYNGEGMSVPAITYTRTFTTGGAYSICLPFEASIPDGITVQEFTGGTDGTVNFASLSASATMQANIPYIIKVQATDGGTYQFHGVARTDGNVEVKAASEVQTVSPEGSDYEFIGNYVPSENLNDVYVLKADGTGFALASDVTIGSFRSYIKGKSGASKIRQLVIGEGGGNATAIAKAEAVSLSVYAADGTLHIVSPATQRIQIHAIDGRLVRSVRLAEGDNTVSALPKGMYIIANQKVIL